MSRPKNTKAFRKTKSVIIVETNRMYLYQFLNLFLKKILSEFMAYFLSFLLV